MGVGETGIGEMGIPQPDYLLNKFCQIFLELWPVPYLGILNLSAR